MSLFRALRESTEGRAQELDITADTLAANGFYVQRTSTPDTTVGLARDSSDRLTLVDAEALSATTLTEARGTTILRVRNTTGSTLLKGKPVYVSGFDAGTGLALVSLADNSSSTTYPAIGLVYADIANNANGYVIQVGLLGGLNTSGFTRLDRLALATSGTLATAPVSGVQQILATVVRSDAAAGILQVCVDPWAFTPIQNWKGVSTQSSDIASAGTTDLSTATGNVVNVTGTTTITALGTVTVGVAYFLKFTGALTLTHNATSLILPGAANITTANGDTMVVISLGSGNWKAWYYTVAASRPLLLSGGTMTGAIAMGNNNISGYKTVTANGEVANTGASTQTIDWTTGLAQLSTLSGNVTYTFTAPAGVCHVTLHVLQNGTGGFTAAWPGTVKWPSGTAPTIPVAINSHFPISFYYDGSNFYGSYGSGAWS